jgi:hypothetical protein
MGTMRDTFSQRTASIVIPKRSRARHHDFGENRIADHAFDEPHSFPDGLRSFPQFHVRFALMVTH